MKFLVAPTREAVGRARPPIALFLAFSALMLAAMVGQRAVQGELSPGGVFEHYLGTGDPSEVMPMAALLETLHVTAFVYGFLLLMLGSLLVVTPVQESTRRALTFGGALACAADLAAPFVIVQAHGLGWLRIVSFVAALAFLGVSIAVVARRFAKGTA
jgi:hypothetical protein